MLARIRPEGAREWKGVTGLNSNDYKKLWQWSSEDYEHINGHSYEKMLSKFSFAKAVKIKTLEELIFYTLAVLKSGITFDFAAFLMGFDHTRGYRQFLSGLNLLHYSLNLRGYLPFRAFNSPEEFEVQFSKSDALIFDATEQKIQRPEDKDFQEMTYSGKKKANTVKAMIISTLDKYIHFISSYYIGKTHDFSLLKEEFNPDLNWFAGYQIRLDLGYQGFKSDYPNATTFLPNKKPRGKDLTEEQKLENRQMASQRIKVEHAIAGIKRYDILTNVCRLHNFDIYDKILAVCAGLWNFYLEENPK